MIKLENVTKIYNNDGVLSTGLHHISLNLNKNEIVAIVGESGCGKSTLLNIITKMDTFDEGEYYYKGNETSYFDIPDMDDFRKNKVGFIFQNYNILDSYSVLQNVMIPLKIQGLSHKEAKKRAMELIKKVGLENRMKNRGSQLSGGEKQRCVIARALASNCEILACDEPTGNLDSKTGQEIIQLIKEVAKDKLVLIVSHNFDQIKDIVTRKIKLHDGSIIEDITYQEVKDEKDVELNLDYCRLKQSIKFNIAKTNLISTPKKTIFSLLILFFVAIFALSLYQTIYTAFENEKYANDFVYKGDNKAIVYQINQDKTVKIEDIQEVCDTYSINDFYSDVLLNIKTNNELIEYASVGYEKHPKDLMLDGGVMPQNDNECILLLPSYYQDEPLSDILNSTFSIDGEMIGKEIKISGYQIREDIGNFIVICKNTYIENVFRVAALNKYEFIIADSQVLLTYDPSLARSKLVLPKYFSNIDWKQDSLFVQDYPILIDYSTVEIVYNDELKSNFYVNQDFLIHCQKQAFEVSIYSNHLDSIIKKLEKKGYMCNKVKTFSNEAELEHFMQNIIIYFLISISSIVILIIYIISSIVLNKVYRSKKKDYNILRTLGISKKDMRDIVVYEVMMQTIVMSIFVYVLLRIIGLCSDADFAMLFKNITFITTLIYFMIMLLFGYFIARSFNTKLFKFSVNAIFKQGGQNHD